MRISRIRLRLTASFALAFLVTLFLLNLGLYEYLRTQADRRLTRRLVTEAKALEFAAEDEHKERPDAPPTEAARGALEDWPSKDLAFLIADRDGRPLATEGPAALTEVLPHTLSADSKAVWQEPSRQEHPARLAVWPTVGPRMFRVVAAGSTAGMSEEMESLAIWLAVSAPLTIVLSLVGGYLLAGRALLPVRELGNQVAALDVEGLSERLPLSANPDELDKLASQFNGLLDRLSTARDANRRFLRQAAHQIRTPLTLVLGEATLSLERQRSPGDQVSTLNRIRLAAEQMRRRVDELFLLAQARSGERVSLDQDIELDGLALETTDLMRSRLTDAGQRLELVDMLPVVARGHEGMLREALIELLENACRYGSRESPIQVSVTREGAHGVFSVASAGPPFAPGGDAFAPNAPNEGHGIGLQVVRWIADQHGGRVQIQRVADTNVVRVYVRLVPLGSNSSTSVAL